MTPQPVYSGENVNPAYSLRYSWTGWPSGSRLEKPPDDQVLAYLLGEALWTENFYVGTFSEYTMRAVRRAGKTAAS